MLKTGEEKRNSYNYRDKFLKHHPGYFNSFYVCSQCLKPITKDELEVDHIFPISRWWAPNHLINLVSTCRNCNRKKSDKVSFSIQIRSIFGKIVEELYLLISLVIKLILKLILFLISYISIYVREQLDTRLKLILLCVVIFIIISILN